MHSKSHQELLDAIGRIPPAPSPALPAPIFQPIVGNKTVFADYEALASQGHFMLVVSSDLPFLLTPFHHLSYSLPPERSPI